MNFYGNKLPKENEHCTCLSVILSDSIFINLSTHPFRIVQI